MPQLNKSEAVHQRLRCFLQRLIGFANYELTECESLERKISVRWIQVETSTPKLIVKTEIRFLAELVFQTTGAKTKDNLKQDLRTLKDFLGLLEDNRDRTQGSGLWHFTLTLWHKSVDKNLAAFDAHWSRCKQSSGISRDFPGHFKTKVESAASAASSGRHRVSDESVTQPVTFPTSRLMSSTGTVSHSSELSDDTATSINSRNPQGAVVVRKARRNFGEDVVSGASQRQATHTQKKACVYHNLPGRDYGKLIGRKQPLQQILRFLDASYPAARLSVTGVGGIGKTALVLEAAYECLKIEGRPLEEQKSETDLLFDNKSIGAFEAVIFTVTKKQRFTPHGILQNYRYSQTLQDLFRTISETLKCPEALAGDFTRQLEMVYELLSAQRTLLIIDNLETLLPESQQAMLSFLYGLPATVKVIVMSRLNLLMDEVIPLTALLPAESMAFIQQQAQFKAVNLSLSECQSFYQQTYGMPAAMVYAMGQLAAGYSVSQVLPKLTLASGDYCRYYLEHAVRALAGTPAFDLLIALSLFPHSAPRDALVHIADLSVETSEDVIIESFAALQQRSLIQSCSQASYPQASYLQASHPQASHLQASHLQVSRPQSSRYERYSMLPLTRDYVLASSRAVLVAARERWLGWYQQWLKAYDHEDWRGWHDYLQIDAEWDALQAVAGWCIEEKRYGDFGLLWRGLKGYTHLRGLWTERLSWLEGWLQAAQAGSDAAVTMQVLGNLSWTLLLMGEQRQLAAAREYLSQAWAYSEALLSDGLLNEGLPGRKNAGRKEAPGFGLPNAWSYQLDLAIDYVVLCLFQASLDEAVTWLAIANKLIVKGLNNDDDRLCTEAQQMRLDYYAAQLCYRQKDYSKAKLLYRKILQRSQQQLQPLAPPTPQQQQAEVYSLNWLVDIALKENDVKEADRLLQQSWPIIQGGKDLRSQAFHQRSKAKLAKRRGNLADFQHWSKQALDCFDTLGMHPQSQEMHEWLMGNSSGPY